MKKVIVLSGISGSGKSTLCEDLLNGSQGVKVSADHFFMKQGEYIFDAARLGEAHADCFRHFIHFLQTKSVDTVLVDNTNCSSDEISPYMLAASAFEWEAEIRTLVPRAEDGESARSRDLPTQCVDKYLEMWNKKS